MKCQYCSSSWESFRQIEKCPFCGKDLAPEPLSFDEIQPALNYVVSKYGKGIYKAEKKCLSLLNDYTRGTENELRLLRICLDSGVVADVITADEKPMAERKIIIQKATAQLEDQYFIKQEMAVKALLWIAVSLGWPVETEESLNVPGIPASEKSKTLKRNDGTEQKFTVNTAPPFRAVPPRPPQQPPTHTDPGKRPFTTQTPPVSTALDIRKKRQGNAVQFGRYPQSADGTLLPIEWIVLMKGSKSALLLSKKVLVCRPYHEASTQVTWEKCSLRRWLNGEFYNAAFSDAEKVLIETTDVLNGNNRRHDTIGGNNTRDNVFLLSAEEQYQYLNSYRKAKCEMTLYAETQGSWKSSYSTRKTSCCWWWLRSPGESSRSAVYVTDGGSCRDDGRGVNDNNGGVRPALWISI